MPPIVGIDLGTTNSLVAVWRDGEARIIPNALGEALTPSVVGLDDTGDMLIGRAARERLTTHPGLTVAAFKRYMGSNREVYVGSRKFRPEELSALVLKSLKADAEAWLGEPVTEAVISVPAYFNDTQRKATRTAGQLAGITVGRLINEPTAAALAYGLHRRDVESTFLVFDLGGGTFDVSVLELLEGVMEVRASTGDSFLGGEDFVDCLVAGFMDAVGRAAGLDDRTLTGAVLQRLRDQAERAKRRLTSRDDAGMRLRWNDRDLLWPIDAETFAARAADLLSRLAAPVERAFRDAKIRPADLDEVLLIGGATRMPIIRKLVARMFGRLPATHLNPDEAVVLGAAVQAGLKARDAALDEVVITDVCPYTLGIEVVRPLGREVQDGWYLPIIERNTTIPASRVERVTTTWDRQKKVDIKVFQGERRSVTDNIPLGKLTVPVPPAKSGEESVDIRFTYDIDGLLEVEATVVSNGTAKAVVIEQNPGALPAKEIARRLKALEALKIHPREQGENRAALARAERLYEESLGDMREHVGGLIATFEAALSRQDPDEIETARSEIIKALDGIEDDSRF